MANRTRHIDCESCDYVFHEKCVRDNSLFGMQANVLEQANVLALANELRNVDSLAWLFMTLDDDKQECNFCAAVVAENFFNHTKDGLQRSCLLDELKHPFGTFMELLKMKCEDKDKLDYPEMLDMCEPTGEFSYVQHITWKHILARVTSRNIDPYNSIAELLFDLKKFDHKKRIVNHFNAEIVEKCDYLQAYAQREATMMHECISCYACYYKQLIENGPKPLYTKTVTEFGGAFLSSCQNPHSVVWIKMPSAAELDRIWKNPKITDTEEMSYGAKRDAISKMANRWFPGKVMPHREPYSLTRSKTHVKVRTFGPQILFLVDIKEQKLFQYSQEMPPGGGGGARGRLTKFQSEAIDEANYYLTHLDKQRFDNTIPEEDPIEFSDRYLIMDHLYIDENCDFKTLEKSDPETFRGGRPGDKAFWICWLKGCNKRAYYKLHNPVSTFCCPGHRKRHNTVESTRKHFGRSSKNKKK